MKRENGIMDREPFTLQRCADRYPPTSHLPLLAARLLACFMLRSILSIVGRLGVCLPVSMRHKLCSTRMPASFASVRCVSPTATRSRMILRARLARAYSTAG